jgi:hypothetical protein
MDQWWAVDIILMNLRVLSNSGIIFSRPFEQLASKGLCSMRKFEGHVARKEETIKQMNWE